MTTIAACACSTSGVVRAIVIAVNGVATRRGQKAESVAAGHARRISPNSRRNIPATRPRPGRRLKLVQKDFPGPLGDTLFAMNIGDLRARQVAVRLSHPQARRQAGEAKPFADVRAELVPSIARPVGGPVRGTPGRIGAASRQGHHGHRQACAGSRPHARLGRIPARWRRQPLGSRQRGTAATVFSDHAQPGKDRRAVGWATIGS